VLLGTLASHFRKLLRLRTGGSVAAPPFVQRKLERQARRYSAARLLAGVRAIHDADLALKGQGGIAPEITIERLVLGLAA
jgi:DNA polymerase III delta subunit